MNNGIIKINEHATAENSVESYVSLKKFVQFLENKVRTDRRIRTHLYKFILERIRQFPELLEGVPAAAIQQYGEVLELVATVVLPLIEDEDEALTGFTSGLSSEVFYATNAFTRLFQEKSNGNAHGQDWINKEASLKLHRQIQYSLLLEKVYGYELPQRRELLHSFFNPATGLYQYYRLNIDTRFVDIKAKSTQDLVSRHHINACMASQDSEEAFEKALSLQDYIAKGFSIITLTDITGQQAIEQMSRIVTSVDKENAAKDFQHITRLLQTIVGSSRYSFGIMPFFTVNNRAAVLYENFNYSILIKACAAAGLHKAVFTRYINHYLQNPRFIMYRSSDTKNTLPVPVQEALKAANIHYYALAPVYFNHVLVGVFEVGGDKDVVELTDREMAKLKPAVPYISQLLKYVIDKFNRSIDGIVRDKFTVIQPSVQWKFNEVAWHYFRNYNIEHRGSVLEKISFKNVYPLYGAVDIRNSTIERNKALRKDLQHQLVMLLQLLNCLQGCVPSPAIESLMKHSRQWEAKLTAYVSIEDELELNDFLFGKVNALLAAQTDLPPNLTAVVKDYFLSTDEEKGSSFSRRRSLEDSIRQINAVINRHFDQFKEDLQNAYPSYFEKFRTDGIEYDIYTGQSIAPKVPFSLDHVEQLRKWQVQSMATVAKSTYALLQQLPYPLQTTQLIFANARPIDISFRNDERRFDVEGAYNIRYHIIKKRIDKVNIRGSLERLTQPGKIAIVYFNERDAAEYASYIKQLQQQHVLQNDLEYLELEELQGVSGLKALRVGVALS